MDMMFHIYEAENSQWIDSSFFFERKYNCLKQQQKKL